MFHRQCFPHKVVFSVINLQTIGKYECAKFSKDLIHTFDLTTTTDEPAVHPHQFCHRSYNVCPDACTKC